MYPTKCDIYCQKLNTLDNVNCGGCANAARAGSNQGAKTPGIGFAPSNTPLELDGLQLPASQLTAKRPPFSNDTTTPQWWTTMTPEEANAAIATAAKATLAAMQAAQAAPPKKELTKPATPATKEPPKPRFTPLHALSFAMLINDEAAAQGDNGWKGWVAEPRRPARQTVASPAYLAPLSLSSYEQFRASRGRPMVYSEQSKRHVMLLPGAQPVGNVTIVSPSGEVVNMDLNAFEDWKRAAGTTVECQI